MEKIIAEHLKCYPKMQIQDIAKLLYQSEFGGGHMIADPGKSLERIKSEYEEVKALDFVSDTEKIGDGMCRIYLSCLRRGVRAETLNEVFVQCANHKKGSIDSLEKKIKECWEVIPFPEQEKQEFFEMWKEQGYPAISHSESYRKVYQPAYRVIEESYVKVFDLIFEIAEKKPRTIGIDGMCGSGKTTLARLLYMNFQDSVLIPMDHFFLQPHQRTKERFEEIGGNIDYERFQEEIISHLHDENGIVYQIYDCSKQALAEYVKESVSSLKIIEGSYSHHPRFGDAYDMRIFCSVSKEEQISRILKRNGEKLLKRFVEEWIPMENRYFDLLERSSGRKLREWDYISY